MDSRFKRRLLQIWDKLCRFAKWCEKHGIPDMLVIAVLKLFLWWLTRQ